MYGQNMVNLYPKVCAALNRNQAMGVASLLGRLGNIVTTFTPYVVRTPPPLARVYVNLHRNLLVNLKFSNIRIMCMLKLTK